MAKNREKKILLKVLLVFLLFFTVFLLIHLSIEGFFGFDSYYHAKHSLLIAQTQNPNLIEPWLEFHFFSYLPTDPWWGYHLILSLFIYFLGPIYGMKVLSSVLAALVFATFYYILKDFKIKYSLVWTWLFFSVSSFFLSRLLLERPLLLAMFFLPLSFLLIARKRYFLLFLTSLAYVLLYNLAPFILIVVLLYMLAEYLTDKKVDLKLLIASLAGLSFGTLLHPRSLNYVYVMFVHIWQVLFLKITGVNLRVAEELQTKSFLFFVRNNSLALTFFLLAMVLYFSSSYFHKREKNRLLINSLGLISFAWFIVALFVPRGIDYWIPFSCLFVAVVFYKFSQSEEFMLIKSFFKEKTDHRIILFFVVSAILIITASNYLKIFNYIHKKNISREDYYFKEVNQWLIDNTEKDSIVFYANWSYWPRMFFYNDHNHYVLGMDPTFLYEYNHDLFWLWVNISSRGIYCNKEDVCINLTPAEKIEKIAPTIKNDFNAEYVLIENNRDRDLVQVLENRAEDFVKTFENKGLVLYKIN